MALICFTAGAEKFEALPLAVPPVPEITVREAYACPVWLKTAVA